MPHDAQRAAHDHGNGHRPGEAHRHAHGEPQRHAGHAAATGAPSSPLWWSAPLRLVCAALLSALLWLVIGWAMA